MIAAAAYLVERIGRLAEQLQGDSHPICGPASVFIGQIHAGVIYNQDPQEGFLEGTRRWLPDTDPKFVEDDFRAMLHRLVHDTGTAVECDWRFIRPAFHLEQSDPLVAAFQESYQDLSGARLATGAKPFVDDGNSFCDLARVAAITHGPRAGGQHTTNEWVDVDDLVRVAGLYALTAARYCAGG